MRLILILIPVDVEVRLLVEKSGSDSAPSGVFRKPPKTTSAKVSGGPEQAENKLVCRWMRRRATPEKGSRALGLGVFSARIRGLSSKSEGHRSAVSAAGKEVSGVGKSCLACQDYRC